MRTIGNPLPQEADTQANRIAVATLVAELRERAARIALGGPETARAAHLTSGKLLPRERIERLLDPGTAFLEIGQFAAWDLYAPAEVPAAGLVTGIGRVEGRLVMLVANDATVDGGACYPLTVKKYLRAQEIAWQSRLPCIYLVDSVGTSPDYQDELFPDRDHFGRMLFNQAQMSAAGILQIAAVMGNCTAANAYVPTMADQSIIVRNQGAVFLTTPSMVKAATGESIPAEELGGGDVHARSGAVDHLAHDEGHALELVRRAISTLPRTTLPAREPIAPPRFDPTELDALAPADTKYPTDVVEIIARIVDDSRFDSFRPLYGETLVCGFAHIEGLQVGILANNGILFPESAIKGAQFIELCEKHRIPLLFMQNTIGFSMGRRFENAGIAKAGAELLRAVATATVPRLTLIIGGSHGAANYAMCGRAYDPRFLWIWPTARVSMMGSEQAATILAQLQPESFATALAEETFKTRIRAQYEHQGSPYYASARLWDDGIIAPADTRTVLGLSLAAALNTPLANAPQGHAH